MKTLCALILLMLAPSWVCGQEQYKFRLIEVCDGLSDNQIRSLSLTPDGRIGIRTASILNIYDGSSFEYFPYDKNRKYVWNYTRPPKEYYDSEGRVWMKELHYLLLLDLKTNEFDYGIADLLSGMGVKGRLKNLFMDTDKNFWLLTEDNTFTFYDAQKKTGRVVAAGGSDSVRRYGIPLELAQYKNDCYIVYSSGLIRRWNYDEARFTGVDSTFVGRIDEYTDRLYIHPDASGNIWLMFNDGVSFYDCNFGTWKDVASISGISNFFTCMDLDKGGNVWVGTSRSGLRHINGRTFRVTTLPDMMLQDGGVLDNDIYTLMVDDNNGLWVGTLFQGLCYHHPTMQRFQLVQTRQGNSYITNESVRCFLEEPDGNILVGTGRGVFRFYPETRQVEHVLPDDIDELVLSLSYDRDGTLWVGTFVKGFYQIRGDGVSKHFSRASGSTEQDLALNTSRDLYEDALGNYWVSVSGGVGLLDPVTGQVREMLSSRHPEVKRFKQVLSICPLDDNQFVALCDNGLYFYDSEQDKVWIPDSRRDPFYQDGIKYFCLLRDSRGWQWFSTEDGIRIWNASDRSLRVLTIADGLPNNSVSSLLEDEQGVVWASTLNGICKITPRKEKSGDYAFSIVNFGVADGLQSGMFYEHSVLKSRNGLFYFGGAHGFNYFDPLKTVYEDVPKRPVLTGLSIFNTPVGVNEPYNGHVILTERVDLMREIVLQHDENFITLEFSGLNYSNPAHTYYKYRLRNIDEGWVETNAVSQGRAVYTGLRPGTYDFEVYAANGDKVWSHEPARLTIVVKPPFWATYYALAVYILVGAALVYYAFRTYIHREKAKLQEERKETARRQQENLDEMKLRFFTNISHEFRTPLTLILTPLSSLIRQQQDETLKRKLEVIYRNAERLLRLVNQLLDFRKLEMKGERLSLQMGDMVVFVHDICESFRELVEAKGIALDFRTQEEHLYMYCDQDKMYKIVSNLLSNAVKFTSGGGRITVSVSQTMRNGRNCVAVSVGDTGCGMAPEDVHRIFTRFYQVDNGGKPHSGSGIGLHLVKGYVDLHGGDITVDSRTGEGSTFTVYIPTDLQGDGLAHPAAAKDAEAAPPELMTDEDNVEKDNGRKKVLVVEDNAEFRTYLVEELSADYDVMEAEDGEQGEQLVLAEYPDLIISDLMMPRCDGVEFCQRVKNNIKTSHIPFILLTAKMSNDSRLESYRVGADSYISKPFNLEMLQVRVRKLIEQREQRKEMFHKTIEITPSSITTTSLDEEFVRKAVACVEHNMDNPDYTLEELSHDMGLSKTHLNRKLTAIINMTPAQFVRSVRLKRAAQLLTGTQYNVNEIADMAGFNTLKYFNKYFKEEFGMTPTQYRDSRRPPAATDGQSDAK